MKPQKIILQFIPVTMQKIKITSRTAENQENRIRVNRISGFSAGKHVTLISLELKAITFKIGCLWETNRAINESIFMCIIIVRQETMESNALPDRIEN